MSMATAFMTPGEAAEPLGVTPSGVRFLVDVGRLRAVRTRSGRRLIDAADVARMARERQRHPVISPARREPAMRP